MSINEKKCSLYFPKSFSQALEKRAYALFYILAAAGGEQTASPARGASLPVSPTTRIIGFKSSQFLQIRNYVAFIFNSHFSDCWTSFHYLLLVLF